MIMIITILGCDHSKVPERVFDLSKFRFINYVDPFIGTAGKGKTYPGATVPNGMVQLSPDNGRNGWDWISGYFYPDSVIAGFSHLHLSGTGAGDLYDISFLPTSGRLKRRKLDGQNPDATVYSAFSHDNESAMPGYYQVYLDDYDVNVELTATARTGLQRYSFKNDDANVRLHLGYTRNWDKVTDSYIKVVNDSTVVGLRRSSGWARDQWVYFKTVFSSPFTYQLSNDNAKVKSDSIQGKNLLATFSFDEQVVMVKTGISSVSVENAGLNLNEEQPDFDFTKVRYDAANQWENALKKVEIEAAQDDLVQFYTAMYHSQLAPTLYSDVNGEYRGTDGIKWKVEEGKRFSTYSLWDTYRALHPWLTIAMPEKVPELINSMLSFYREEGLLPVWNMWGSETNMMMGYHAVPVVADAIVKDLPGIDYELAYQAIVASANQNLFDLNAYKEIGYVPYERGSWNVSRTLEYAFDDWCIANVAKDLGKEEDYKYFLKRSENYKNHFDPASGFFRAKSQNGEFKADFDPLSYNSADYCEANAWQYLWYVPQNVEHLITLMGGANEFETKLDEMFQTEQETEDTPEWISGYIGQYVHGNEPSHHVPYLYQYTGAGNKTAEKVRTIMNDLYTTNPDGLAGNEDCGQMSAWYLFSALGFYPVNPGAGEYIIGSPIVEKAIINLPEGNQFKIIVNNQSDTNIYVDAILLNDKPIEGFILSHEQIMKGGEMVITMTNELPSS